MPSCSSTSAPTRRLRRRLSCPRTATAWPRLRSSRSRSSDRRRSRSRLRRRTASSRSRRRRESAWAVSGGIPAARGRATGPRARAACPASANAAPSDRGPLGARRQRDRRPGSQVVRSAPLRRQLDARVPERRAGAPRPAAEGSERDDPLDADALRPREGQREDDRRRAHPCPRLEAHRGRRAGGDLERPPGEREGSPRAGVTSSSWRRRTSSGPSRSRTSSWCSGLARAG